MLRGILFSEVETRGEAEAECGGSAFFVIPVGIGGKARVGIAFRSSMVRAMNRCGPERNWMWALPSWVACMTAASWAAKSGWLRRWAAAVGSKNPRIDTR